ncbi:MAG: hypothetical protein Ct9H90mP5_10210 [Acidimicrobiaceae bacterium]|nr:MAG: hypothetical protein Ct9H90mP5_10210 [Acidimicrobiaceae bacterium]
MDLGADQGIDYRKKDFVEAVKTWTNGNGGNIIIDLVGGSYLQHNVKAISTKGIIVQVWVLKGSGKPELD